MILVDTSIWVDHARHANETLTDLLARDAVVGHPFVVGELALGGFKPAALRLLTELPGAILATNDEVLTLIQRKSFAGRGIGYVDAHLLASARLTADTRVWTSDTRMRAVADELGVLAPFVVQQPR